MGRPAGNAPWSPSADSLKWLERIKQVFADHGTPLGPRGVAYRLMDEHGLPKGQFAKIERLLVRARRAGLIPWEWVADGREEWVPGLNGGWDSPEDWWRAQFRPPRAKDYDRRINQGQLWLVEIWCEAAAMIPQLEQAVWDEGVDVRSCSGNTTVGPIYSATRRAQRQAKRTEGRGGLIIGHVGDLDPSGVDMPRRLRQEAEGFEVADVLLVERVALTPETAVKLRLPVSEIAVKAGRRADPRLKVWTEGRLGVVAGPDGRAHGVDGLGTVQAEAMPPAALHELAQAFVRRHIDSDQRERVARLVESERSVLRDALRELPRPPAPPTFSWTLRAGGVAKGVPERAFSRGTNRWVGPHAVPSRHSATMAS